jgi:glycine/D-amino acid oxidase-like deaminating enzyme
VKPDVAVVGGGIVGCSLAAFLAEAGASVVLYEREELAAGASGRNSGVLQDPLDPELTGLYEESLRHYAQLEGFALPADPVGLLIAGEGPAPEVPATYHENLQAIEPALAPMPGYRVETGRPVPPAAAAAAFAHRALAAGAALELSPAALAATVARSASPWTACSRPRVRSRSPPGRGRPTSSAATGGRSRRCGASWPRWCSSARPRT